MAGTGKKHTDLTDRELVELAVRQDRDAFSLLLARYREALIAHILKYVSVPEDAEDICQRSLEKAYVNIGKYDSRYAFSTWLYSIAGNEARDHIRKSRNTLSSVPLAPGNEDPDILAGITPEEEFIVGQAVKNMTSSIAGLPEKYRAVAELRFIQDYSYDEIAVKLGIPIGTVKTRLNRARKMLVSQKDSDDEKNN